MCRKFGRNDTLVVAGLASVMLIRMADLHSKHLHENLAQRSAAWKLTWSHRFGVPLCFRLQGTRWADCRNLEFELMHVLSFTITFKWNHNEVEGRHRPAQIRTYLVVTELGRFSAERIQPNNCECLSHDWVFLNRIPQVCLPRIAKRTPIPSIVRTHSWSCGAPDCFTVYIYGQADDRSSTRCALPGASPT